MPNRKLPPSPCLRVSVVRFPPPLLILATGFWLLASQPALAAPGTASSPSTTAASHKPGDITLEPASVTLPNSQKIDYELGTLYVPENRDDPKSRTIAIGFARFKATTPSSAPPIFYLPGGPGTSFLASFKTGNNINHLNRYRAAADVIAVDQRGFSELGDVMTYTYNTADEPLDHPGSLAKSTELFLQSSRDAVAAFEKKGFDLKGYTVKQCAHDVDDLRKALHLEKISLVGISFGSQWSFAIMRLHPDIVARAVESGVEPLNNGYDMPSEILRDTQRFWKVAEKDPTLAPYIPAGGIEAAAKEILKRLDAGPINVQIKDPKTSQPLTITLGKEDFQRDFLHSAVTGPAFILSLYHQHYDAWALSVLAKRRSHQNVLRMIGPLIDTSLGVTPDRERLLRADPATAFLGQWNWDAYIASADIYPTVDVGDDFRTPIPTNIPVIFCHGDWDTSTPLENSLEIVKSFPNAKLLVIEHGEHSAREPLAQSNPKVWSQLIDFLKTGTMPDLPAQVTLPAPKFSLPDFPPPKP